MNAAPHWLSTFSAFGELFLIPQKDQTVRLIYLYVNGENKRKIRENNRGAANTAPYFFGKIAKQ